MGLRPDTPEFVSTADELGGASKLAPRKGSQQRHFLFVTAPFGAFSRQLARRLRKQGARCSRVLLNGGDLLDWGPRNARAYFGPFEGWGDWLAETVRREGITDLLLYGDCSPHCVEARRVAARLSLDVHVFEQGYFRPFWITLERDGVNANSPLRRELEVYRATDLPAPPPPVWLPPLTPPAVRRIFAYHVALGLLKPVFARYRPPYADLAHRQLFGHTRRYIVQRFQRPARLRRLARTMAQPGRIYLALLQRPGDSQLLRHSSFKQMADFIVRVVDSFARFAPPDARLIVKSHPLDPGLERHDLVVARAAAAAGVSGRVSFVDDGDLYAMLKRVSGVVTVNSTSGLAALEEGRPTIALGQAIYSLPGLTHQGGLDSFWSAPESPDPELFDAFRRVEMTKTQINGAYASRRGCAMAADEAARRLLSH
jgi:capsular polysaccharide export protein